MNVHAFRQASSYIESLRNPKRKKFARDFYQYLRSKGRAAYPESDLPPMARQTVISDLLEIMEPAGYGLP